MGASSPNGRVSANGHGPYAGRPSRVSEEARRAVRGRQRPVGWLLLFVLFELWFATFVVAQHLRGMPSLVVITAGLVGLGLAGWRWGVDSRDGQDWGPDGRP